nr:prepilin-type N-terminal cleavage/methylation domain-containing protein [Sporolactobacillus spathodeae]
MLKKSKKNQKGFTLIELLAVIVILAILAAIAIPSVISIIHTQNQKALAQDALNAIHATKIYVADQNPTLPVTNASTASDGVLNSYVDKAGGTGGHEYKVSVNTSYDYTVNGVATGDLPDNAPSTVTEANLIYFSQNGKWPTANQ